MFALEGLNIRPQNKGSAGFSFDAFLLAKTMLFQRRAVNDVDLYNFVGWKYACHLKGT